MNPLTKILLEDILEADNKKITAIYGGGFKPPTKGHFNVIEKAAEQNPEIDDIIIYVGGGERDGITQGESIQIWELYKKYLPIKTIVEPVKAPVGDILRYAKEHPEETVLWIIGARENNPEDFTDIASRTRTIEKYPNLQLRVIQTAGGVSGTAARKAVRDNNQEQFYHLIPDIPEKEQVWDIVSPVVTEGVFKDLKSTLKSIWSKGGKLTQDIIDGAKREGKETSKLIQLLNKMLHGDSITDDEKIFMKAQGKDLLKVLPLVAIQGIPLPIPITPLLLVLGKKFGFNILPDSHEVMPLSSLAEVNNSYQKALSKTEEEALELTYKNWDTFGGKECNNGFCDIFAKNLSKYLPGSKIMSTEDPRNNTLGHVWVEYEGKYFDAETPNGVNSWKQLPWMIEFYSKNKSHPTDIETLNEVGEANLKPYKWKEVDRESYFVYTRFVTDSETQYDVDLKSTNYVDDDLNNLRALGIEFSAKLKGDEGSSAKIVVNKGEMYKVMSTIADIIKTYIKKSKSQAILYSPSKKSDEEDFGTQRDNLYRAFISKAFPGVKFKQDGEIVAAILPNSVNELVTDTDVICDNCGWEWPIADGGDDLYICHKCGHDNNPDLEEGTCGYDTDVKTGEKLNTPGGLEEGRPKKKDPKKGTGKKPEGSGRRLYTDEDPKDTVSIKFKTKEDIVDTLNKKQFKAKSHSRQSQVINLIHQRVRSAYGKSKDPEVRSRLKRALDYIEKRKEMSKKKTERLRKMKEVSDPFGLNELARQFLKEALIETWNPQESFVSLSKFMIDNGMNIQPLPKVKIISNDEENASNLLGKTAYYNPNDKSITLYTKDRHPKDILRSFSHEMVHHEQNLEDRLNNINTTNTNEDGALPEIEKEAYEKGNMMLRNWEDNIKNV